MTDINFNSGLDVQVGVSIQSLLLFVTAVQRKEKVVHDFPSLLHVGRSLWTPPPFVYNENASLAVESYIIWVVPALVISSCMGARCGIYV